MLQRLENNTWEVKKKNNIRELYAESSNRETSRELILKNKRGCTCGRLCYGRKVEIDWKQLCRHDNRRHELICESLEQKLWMVQPIGTILNKKKKRQFDHFYNLRRKTDPFNSYETDCPLTDMSKIDLFYMWRDRPLTDTKKTDCFTV